MSLIDDFLAKLIGPPPEESDFQRREREQAEWRAANPEPPQPYKYELGRGHITVYPTYDEPLSVEVEGVGWRDEHGHAAWRQAEIRLYEPLISIGWRSDQYRDQPAQALVDEMVGTWHRVGFAIIGGRHINLQAIREIKIEVDEGLPGLSSEGEAPTE